MSTPVLIVGAGPTGLALATFLHHFGAPFRIVDASSGPAQRSKAMGVQARTLELYRILGLADGAVALGVPADRATVRVEGEVVGGFSLGEMGRGLSPYPFLLTLAQDVHEHYLLRHLEDHGVHVEWDTALLGLEEEEGAVLAHLDGGEAVRACWLVGCDGAHSTVRKALDIGFPGGTSEGLFFVADVDIDRENRDINVGLDERAVNLLFPVRTTGTQRVIGFVNGDAREGGELQFEEVRPVVERLLDLEVRELHWFSSYRVSHRVADRFRQGRCFLAGDAGHIHSPVGGQGMNTGIGDAMNLAWKLAGVHRRTLPEAVLDTYEAERMPFARTLIQTTDRAFQRVSAEGAVAGFVRTRVVPVAIRALSGWSAARPRIFRAISQIRIAYPGSSLSVGRVGGVRAGDRLPWLEEVDNHAVLDGRWQVQVYGEVPEELATAARELGLLLHPFAPAGPMSGGGVLLVRPDGHVGLASTAADAADALRGYASTWLLA